MLASGGEMPARSEKAVRPETVQEPGDESHPLKGGHKVEAVYKGRDLLGDGGGDGQGDLLALLPALVPVEADDLLTPATSLLRKQALR